MRKNKWKSWATNLWDFISLNVPLCVAVILFIISAGLTIGLNKIDLKYKNDFNIIMGVLNSFFGICFAYFFGTFKLLKQEKINLIQQYIKYLENLNNDLKKSILFLNNEFIYSFQYIIDFMKHFIEKFYKKESDLFFMEKWKLSSNHKNLSNIIQIYQINFENFKKSINDLKGLKLNEETINGIIVALVKYNFIQNIADLQKILEINQSDNFKKIINFLNEFVFYFRNKHIEILKVNLKGFLNEVEKRLGLCFQRLEKCSKHRHFKKRIFCWSTIKVLYKNIFSEEKILKENKSF